VKFPLRLLELERRRQGLTGTELARKMKVSRGQVSEVERGHRRPGPDFRRKAARALRVPEEALWPVFYFFVRDDEPGGGILTKDARPVVFADHDQASRVAEEAGWKLQGPVGLDFFAQLLGLEEEAARRSLLVDPPLEDLKAGAAP
jgi:transcriptional regulator with XRE-family HTH domain